MKLYSIDDTIKVANILKKKGYKKATCIALSIIMAYTMSSFNTRNEKNNSHMYDIASTYDNVQMATMPVHSNHIVYEKMEKGYSVVNEDDSILGEKTIDEVATELEKIISTDVVDSNNLENGISTNTVDSINLKDTKQAITVDNMDLFTKEEIIAYICEKYNLTDFEFKVIASTVYHEAYANNYDDYYRVINTIYNRTKSKLWVSCIKNYTGVDGTSMYAQVIAPGQFAGCIKGVAGYDYDTLLNTVIYDGTKPFETTLDAIFSFLLSEECIHNFLSFKGLYWEVNAYERMQPGFGVTNWVRYTELGNIYHDPLTSDDLIDENYHMVSPQESGKILSRNK